MSKNSVMILGALIFGIGIWAAIYSSFTPKKINSKIAEELSKELPEKISEGVTWIAIEADGLKLIYSYKLDLEKSALKLEDVAEAQKKQLFMDYCKNDDNSDFLKDGTIVVHKLFDTNNTLIRAAEIKDADCD